MGREPGRGRTVSPRHGGRRPVPQPRRRPSVADPAGQPVAALRLELLGPFVLRHRERAVRPLPKKAQALLAYLAMRRGRPIPREQLADLLWGRSGGDQARRSLRQCLMSVRAALAAAGDNTLIGDADSVSLPSGHSIDVDVTAFETLSASKNPDELESAAALYRDELLSGLQVRSEPFTDWLLLERRRLASVMSDILYRLAGGRVQAGDTGKAIAAAERLAAFDPLREDAHRLLMRLLAVAGRRSAALEQHARCVDILRRELGVAPEPATAELAEAIRGGHVTVERTAATAATVRARSPGADDQASAARTAEPTLALPEKPSIALLPFSNLSGDPNQDYFADGMADDLAISLGRIPWLFVIASSATSRYRGHAVDARQVGAELGVRYVLRGSVRRSNRRLRIVVQLTDASHGRHIWSDRFEGDLDDVFAIQDSVTAQVSGFIAPALQMVEIDRAQRKPTESLTAFDLYLRAVPRFRTSLPDNREAIRLLRKAIEIDPAYGAAYGLAARCYQFQKLLNWVPLPDPQLDEGVRLGHLAAQIGHNDSEALWMAGHALAQLSGEVEHGLALLDRSLALNPNSANAWVSSCNVRCYVDDAKTALEHFGRADRLNPLDSMHHVRWNILGLAFLCGGDFEETAKAADKALSVAPTYLPALRLKVIACGLLGRTEEGHEHARRLLAVSPGESVAWLRAFWGPPMRRNPRTFANMLDGARLGGLPEGEPP
jgi:TolB-like protein